MLGQYAARPLTRSDAQIKAIDNAAGALTEGDLDVDRRRTRLESSFDFGETTAIALLADMPELCTRDQVQAAACHIPAPMTRQRGQ